MHFVVIAAVLILAAVIFSGEATKPAIAKTYNCFQQMAAANDDDPKHEERAIQFAFYAEPVTFPLSVKMKHELSNPRSRQALLQMKESYVTNFGRIFVQYPSGITTVVQANLRQRPIVRAALLKHLEERLLPGHYTLCVDRGEAAMEAILARTEDQKTPLPTEDHVTIAFRSHDDSIVLATIREEELLDIGAIIGRNDLVASARFAAEDAYGVRN